MINRSKISTLEEFNQKISSIPDGSINYRFSDIVFEIELELSTKEANLLIFDNCIFEKDVFFPRIVRNKASFINTTFKKDASFKNSLFIGKVRFYQAKFKGNVDFDNTKFKDLADFWNATFFNKVIFYKTDFLGTTVFSSTTFIENILFTYSLIDKVVIFRDTKFEKGLDLSLAIISGQVSIFNIELSDFSDINDTNDPIEFNENVSENGVITRKNKRETFRILKTQLLLNQNSIDALKFSSLEVKAYTKQLHQNIFVDKQIKKYWQNYSLLKLNWISNKHGLSWWRGVVFTFLIGLFFFYFSILSTDNYVFSLCDFEYSDFLNSIKYYFEFMLPTHKIDYLINEKPTAGFYFWDFLGRIFVSYGIYQTIQAFRKFKNK